MYTRKFKPPGRSYFLFGPRGTGKTTWLSQHYGEAVFFDLLNPSVFLRLSRDPAAFREEVAALSERIDIVVDEVQKLPILLDDIHYFLARPNNKRKFILTGSSARKLKRSSANLLAGRASQRHFHPLVAAEHGMVENIDDLLRFGTLPEVLNLKSKQDKVEFLEAYVLTYLREEIQQEAVTRNIDDFSRFLEVSALANAQLTNISALSRDAGVARTTLHGYFQALEDTLVARWLPAWSPRVRIKEVSHPKFYFFDPGVVRALRGRVRNELSSEERGGLLETYLLHELVAWNDFHDWGAKISYWRTPSGREIDFVIEKEKRRIAIEVKSSSEWKNEYGKAMRELKDEGKIHRAIGVYLGSQNRRSGDLEIKSLKTFLTDLARDEIF